eukprot:NODE_472_length_8038_cov_0.413150.p5 type:complete len:254 gc:universal NODE_472_length_8038_cov_0.413150:267-1028(+)
MSSKNRRRLTIKETSLLNSVFEHTRSPDAMLRAQLGIQLNMSSRNVQIWFQNKRAHIKRITGGNLTTEISIPNPFIKSQQKSPITPLLYNKQILPKSDSSESIEISVAREVLYPVQHLENQQFSLMKMNVLISVLLQDIKFKEFMSDMERELRIDLSRLMDICRSVSAKDDEKQSGMRRLVSDKLSGINSLILECGLVFKRIENCILDTRCESCSYCKFWKDCTQIPFINKVKHFCLDHLVKLKGILEISQNE